MNNQVIVIAIPAVPVVPVVPAAPKGNKTAGRIQFKWCAETNYSLVTVVYSKNGHRKTIISAEIKFTE